MPAFKPETRVRYVSRPSMPELGSFKSADEIYAGQEDGLRPGMMSFRCVYADGTTRFVEGYVEDFRVW